MSGANFSLSFDPQQLQAVISLIAATPAEVNKAADRAARHTMNVMKTLIARTVAAETGIPVTQLKTRVTVNRYAGDRPSWVLFVGLNEMPYDKAGSISQNQTGLSQKGKIVKGGFDKDVFSNGSRGWIRKKRARELGLNHLPGLYRNTGREPPKENQHNFPVMRISHDLSVAANAVIMAFKGKATDRFHARFEHDLKHIKGLK